MTAGSAAAFDRIAASYDDGFTSTELGRRLRRRVWNRLLASFSTGDRILELNCGTGEDACFLSNRGIEVIATDGSQRMLEQARAKAQELDGASPPIEFRQLALENGVMPFETARFDGVFSNFGGLNCVKELSPLASSLARVTRPGAALILVVMGPLCLWDIAYHLFKGNLDGAFRRLRHSATARVGGAKFHVSYPRPGDVARKLSPWFRRQRLTGLGVALPPSLLAAAFARHSTTSHVLDGLETGLAPLWPFRYLGDHYILEMRRGRDDVP